MLTRLPALLLLALTPSESGAAFVVIGNYTADPVAFSVAEAGAKPREYKLPANHVLPVFVTGPATINFIASERATALLLDPYNAYVFIPDKKAGFRFEGLELPGNNLERDARLELNPVPRDPVVKIPVTLYVDDLDPRAEQLWRKELRGRFEEAAAAIEKAAGIRLELAGFDTWKVNPEARTVSELLTGFEAAVKVERLKPGSLVVGYSNLKIDEKLDASFGANRGLGGRHILLREGRPKNEPERAEVLTRYLAQALGAVGSPDPGSALRSRLGDGYILRRDAVLRLDPLNALALNLWADERRREPGVDLNSVSAPNRHRLTRVYHALLKAAPGDMLARAYLNELDAEAAKQPEPMARNPDRPPAMVGPRDELARLIIRAIIDRAERNSGPNPLTGDELTAAYIRAAAETAVAREGPEMVSGFLIGLGLALDETGALCDDPITGSDVRQIESAAERKTRLRVLGNPTLAGRRDLCRRFVLGCAAGELLPREKAENAAVGRALFDLHQPAGSCIPALAAEWAGIAFASAAQNDAGLLRDVIPRFAAVSYLPSMSGFRNGLSPGKFEELYGDTADGRFVALLAEIRKRLKGLDAYR